MSIIMTPDDATGTPYSKRSCIGDPVCEYKKYYENTHNVGGPKGASSIAGSTPTIGTGVSTGSGNQEQLQPQQPQQQPQLSPYQIQEQAKKEQAQKNNEAQTARDTEFARRVAEQDEQIRKEGEGALARGRETEAQREQAKKDADRELKEEIYNKEMKQLMSEQLRLAKENDERNFALQVQQYNANQTINQNARNRSKQLQGGMRPGSTISGEDFKQFELKSENKNPFQFQPRKRK